MPWQECSEMDWRLRFVARLLDGFQCSVMSSTSRLASPISFAETPAAFNPSAGRSRPFASLRNEA
jgi:hypothetical protein